MLILKLLFWPFYLIFWLLKALGVALFMNDVVDHFES